MIISHEQTIAGRPAVEMRDLMRLMRDRAYTVLGLAEDRAMEEGDARRLIADLLEEGLVERTEWGTRFVVGTAEDGAPTSRLEFFSPNLAGVALAKARIGKRMARTEANRLLQGVIDRATAVNDSQEWLHWVREVVLYGSFAADGDGPVGDVDVAVAIKARFERTEYEERQVRMIGRDGARPASTIDAIGYAQTKLLRYLRGRSPRVDLTEVGEGRPLPPDATAKCVYLFAPSMHDDRAE